MADKKQPNTELILYRLDQIDEKLDSITKQYVTKEEFNALLEDVQALKKSRTLIGWLYPTASAAFSAIVTYLLISFFDAHK